MESQHPGAFIKPKSLMTPARDDLDHDLSSMHHSSSRYDNQVPDEDTFNSEQAQIPDETMGHRERRQ